jgi:hypothetical protein
MRAQGNRELVNHGIQNEESDIRAHVGVYAQKVYVFRTEAGREVIQREPPYRCVPVYTGSIQTAEGYVVPARDIEGCCGYGIPEDIFAMSGIGQLPEYGYQGQKGKAATYIVNQMLKRGLIPIPITVTEVDDQAMQIRGVDVQARVDIAIQVKCDYRAGQGSHPRCTGNLFLQTKECNPWGIH